MDKFNAHKLTYEGMFTGETVIKHKEIGHRRSNSIKEKLK
jgi:hypothetical protein